MSEQLKILVIEDSPEFRNFIVEYLLKPNDFAVTLAEDGLSGLSLALKTRPDLILLDYELPKLNGVGVLHQLRNRGQTTPVILMTSNGSEQLAVEVFQLGVQNYLVKPFDLEEALRTMREALQVTYLEKEKQALLQRLTQANRALKHQLDLADVMYQIGKSITLIYPTQRLERIVDAALFLTNAEEGRLFFNAPLPQPDHALRAVRAALLLKQAVIATQKQLSAEYHLDFGIGVCVGEAVIGNIGTPKLMNYTAVDDSVNKAKRLQEQAKGGQILITQETLVMIHQHVQVRPIGRLLLKGQAAEEPMFEVMGLKQEEVLKLAPTPSIPALVAVMRKGLEPAKGVLL